MEALFTKRILIGWGIVVFILAAIPVQNDHQIDVRFMDKFAHIGIYIILTCLIYGYTSRNFEWSTIKTSFFAIILSGSYGIFLELMQLCFFESRSFELADIISNIIGSFIGTFLMNRFFNLK